MEETQATDSGEAVVTETLDDIISEYNVQAPPAQVQSSQPQEKPTVTPVAKVDPLDESQFQTYTQQVAQNQTALNSQVRELSEKLTQIEQKDAELRIETDIKSAVGIVNDGLDLDPRVVRTHLELTAADNPGFKKIWDNRHNDPNTFKRALKAVSKDVGSIYAVKQDSELTETQAAIRQSQQTMASKGGTKQTSTAEDALQGASTQAEFDAVWRKLTG